MERRARACRQLHAATRATRSVHELALLGVRHDRTPAPRLRSRLGGNRRRRELQLLGYVAHPPGSARVSVRWYATCVIHARPTRKPDGGRPRRLDRSWLDERLSL